MNFITLHTRYGDVVFCFSHTELSCSERTARIVLELRLSWKNCAYRGKTALIVEEELTKFHF